MENAKIAKKNQMRHFEQFSNTVNEFDFLHRNLLIETNGIYQGFAQDKIQWDCYIINLDFDFLNEKKAKEKT